MIIKRISIFIFFLLSPVLAFCQIFTLQNPSSLALKGKVVALPWALILSKNANIDSKNFAVIDVKTNKAIPYQLEYLGETSIQNVLFQLDLPAKKDIKIKIVSAQPGVFKAQTFCRFVPERKDDFAWENDKIAFRMYGKALEATPKENAYGIDVWVKRTIDLVVDKRYKHGDYHTDLGDGLDYYKVGYTLGAGNAMPIVGDSIYYSKNYTSYKILDNGPLKSTFELIYDAWLANGQKVSCTKRISLEAGSQLNKIEVKYSFENPINQTIAIGIVKRNETGQINLLENEGIMAYWEPEHGTDGITGVGTIVMEGNTKMTVNKIQMLQQMALPVNQSVQYYQGACWNKAKQITTGQAWINYLKDFKAKAAVQLTIK